MLLHFAGDMTEGRIDSKSCGKKAFEYMDFRNIISILLTG